MPPIDCLPANPARVLGGVASSEFREAAETDAAEAVRAVRPQQIDQLAAALVGSLTSNPWADPHEDVPHGTSRLLLSSNNLSTMTLHMSGRGCLPAIMQFFQRIMTQRMMATTSVFVRF
jgi:hypothetical protein